MPQFKLQKAPACILRSERFGVRRHVAALPYRGALPHECAFAAARTAGVKIPDSGFRERIRLKAKATTKAKRSRDRALQKGTSTCAHFFGVYIIKLSFTQHEQRNIHCTPVHLFSEKSHSNTAANAGLSNRVRREDRRRRIWASADDCTVSGKVGRSPRSSGESLRARPYRLSCTTVHLPQRVLIVARAALAVGCPCSAGGHLYRLA